MRRDVLINFSAGLGDDTIRLQHSRLFRSDRIQGFLSSAFTTNNTHQSTALVVGPMIQPSLQKAISATVKGPVVWNAGAMLG